MSIDAFVEGPNVVLAVRDFGGEGEGIILLHGLSRTLADWNRMAPLLGSGHRVVAMDVRGHGRSGDGPWSWKAAVDDVDVVAEQFGMNSPAVISHSLGGMIASMWGREHADARGAINLDGHGNPRADQYVGLDPNWVTEKRCELEAIQRQQLAALSGPLSEMQVGALTAQQRAVAAQLGAPADQFLEGLSRMLEIRSGRAYLRPAPDGFGGEIYASLDEVDMFKVYRETQCPLLLFNAVEPDGRRGTPASLSWISELTAAFRQGQTRDLVALAGSQSNVQVETVLSGHGLLFEHSAAIARTTLSFLNGRD